MTRNPFCFWEKHGFLEFQSGDVRIYNVGGDQFLFVGQTMYASTRERDWYIRHLMPVARGNVLEVGLGLGCASKVLLASRKVQSLLTIEKNLDVVAAFGEPLGRHMILLADINDWVSSITEASPMYDLIFVDHYTMGDEDEQLPELQRLAVQLEPLLKKGGSTVFWIDEVVADETKADLKKLWLTK